MTKRVGLRQVRLHDLRHGAASGMLQNGADLLVVSRVLGHSSISVTSSIYAHLDPRQGEAAIAGHAQAVAWRQAGAGA